MYRIPLWYGTLAHNHRRRRNLILGHGLWKDLDQHLDRRSGLLINLFLGASAMKTTLTNIIEEWYGEREIGEKRRAQLHYSARNFASFAGTECTTALEDNRANQWIRHQLDNGRSPRTVRSNRCNLITLWNAAYERGYVPVPPRRVRKVRLNRIIPRCWTPEQFDHLLATIPTVRGLAFPGIAKRDWLRALCLVGLSTGLRKGDLLSLERSFFLPGWSLSIVQSKTGDVHTARLGARAIEAVQAIPEVGSCRLFPWAFREDAFTKMFARLVNRAGLPGSFKWIRRSGATWIARKHGMAAASLYLGHRTPELARLNYVDPSQVMPETFLPEGA